VDFKNTILILTSNLGSHYLLDGIEADGSISQEAQDAVDQLLKATFRPEFLNRLDETVLYKPLSRDNIEKIVDLQLAQLNARLDDKQLVCTVSPEAKQYIIDSAYDPQYGARPLRRFIQHSVETLIAREIISGEYVPGDKLEVIMRDGEMVVQEVIL